MTPRYFIWNTTTRGWVLSGGNHGTALDERRVFTRENAIAYAKRGWPAGQCPLLLVAEEDLLATGMK